MSLETTALTVNRRHGPTLSFPALSVVPGARTLLLGPSGSGKTTWLSLLAGLLPPQSGSVMLGGQDIYKLAPRRRDRLRGTQFGFVFQTLHLLPALTLRQNIALAAKMAGLPANPERLEQLLSSLDLTAKAHRRPSALSQGEQQRAAIARAVFNRPAIIIADEPTSALDDNNAQAVIELLESCAVESNAALVVATHDKRLLSRFSHVLQLPGEPA